jgi:hypothetical protein
MIFLQCRSPESRLEGNAPIVSERAQPQREKAATTGIKR